MSLVKITCECDYCNKEIVKEYYLKRTCMECKEKQARERKKIKK